MASKIQIRRGVKSKLPVLAQGELAYVTDTGELYVGKGSTNLNVSGTRWLIGTDLQSNVNGIDSHYAFSGCPDVKIGDIYFNNENGNIYYCVAAGKDVSASWRYKGTVALSASPGESLDTMCDMLIGLGTLKGKFSVLGTNSASDLMDIESSDGKYFADMDDGYYYVSAATSDYTRVRDKGSHDRKTLSESISEGERVILDWKASEDTVSVVWKG